MTPELNRIYPGDCLEIMKTWPDAFIQTVVTSPPYWGLRDYGVTGQIGLEESPEAYVAKMVAVFREVRRVLRDDGTLWLNLGDSYASTTGNKSISPQTAYTTGRAGGNARAAAKKTLAYEKQSAGYRDFETLKPKDLVGIPWRVAFALQADGWYLRSDIIWAKPNPMPESVTDRPTKAHEYLFLMTKSDRYYYDADAVKEACARAGEIQTFGGFKARAGQATGGDPRNGHRSDKHSHWGKEFMTPDWRNKRSVWTVATQPYTEAHFATFPPDLIRPCILAGSKPQDIVFDPFMGAGTTALVALEYDRRFIGTELNPIYAQMAERRIASEKAQIKLAI